MQTHRVSQLCLAALCSPLFFFVPHLSAAPPESRSTHAELASAYGQLPLSFEANNGQTDSRVKYVSRGKGYSLYLTPAETVLVLGQARTIRNGRMAVLEDDEASLSGNAGYSVLRTRLIGANSAVQIEGQDELPGKVNYFVGSDPAKWHSNISTFAKVIYKGIYPGVDLVYHGSQRQLEYDFVVAPGFDPHTIKLAFEGAGNVQVDGSGDLVMQTSRGKLRHHKPVVYQEINGSRRIIAGRYAMRGKTKVGFDLGRYDSSKPLIIDPVLDYSTYLGGTGEDDSNGITIDSSGNAYVTGSTSSVNFPTTAGVFQAAYQGGGSDAFVTKLNATGTGLIYSTYLGGSGDDGASNVAVDSSGNFYVTGFTSSLNFPITPSARQSTYGGGFLDVFVTKFNSTGSAILYSTYLGGSATDFANFLVLDSAQSVYTTGTTTSGDFPTTAGAFQTIKGGGPGSPDAYCVKINTTASGAASLVYSTYFGGSRTENGFGIAVNSAGEAYVSGNTRSADMFTTAGAFSTSYSGVCGSACTSNGFVAKFNASGSGVLYATYLGGSTNDAALAITVDGAGNAFVGGGTASANFPVTPGSFQTTYAGGLGTCDFFSAFLCGDGFMAKLNPAASGAASLVYSTFFGGSGGDVVFGIAVDGSANAYIAGSTTSSSNFPIKNAVQPTFGGGNSDAFLARLNPVASGISDLVYSTYLGGSGDEIFVVVNSAQSFTTWAGGTVALDSFGNVFMTGATSSPNFPVTAGAYQTVNNGGVNDGFVAKITQLPGPNAGGRFAIGDGNAVVGNHVTFLSPQWSQLNSLSGGQAPTSFKGFVPNIGARTCGDTWTIRAANTTSPPNTLPTFIGVIVSSSITKSGPETSGNIPQMVIVKVDPGYDGRSGTGTVMATICP